MSEQEQAIQSIIGDACAEPHAGKMCPPESHCPTCEGIRVLLRTAHVKGYAQAREQAARRVEAFAGTVAAAGHISDKVRAMTPEGQ